MLEYRTQFSIEGFDAGLQQQMRPAFRPLHLLLLNWLRVLDTTERSQVDQRIRHQLHAIVPLLDAFKSEQQPLELIFPGKGPFDTHPQRMNRGVEEPLASALGALAVARILWNVGDQARIEDALPIVRRIKAAIKVEIDTSEVVWPKNSCGLALVVFQQPAKPLTTLQRACTYRVSADRRKEQHIPLTLMIALVMQMLHVLCQRMAE